MLLWVGAGLFALLISGFVAVPIQIWLSARAVRAAGINLKASRAVPRTWPNMIRMGVPFGLLVMGLSFNANVITVLLGAFSEVATVGWYSASYRLIFHLVGILGGFLTAMMPSLTRMYTRDRERAVRWTWETFSWLVLIVMPVAAGLSLLAPRAIKVLYGDSYAPAGPVLRLLAWDIALMLAVGYLANVCVAGGLERTAAGIYVVGMVANVVLAVALISAYGMTGAAVVNIIIDGGVALAFVVVLRTHGWLALSRRRLGQIVAATTLMGAIVWVCLPLPLILVVAAGAVSYAVLVVALGLIEWRSVTTSHSDAGSVRRPSCILLVTRLIHQVAQCIPVDARSVPVSRR